MRGVDVVSWWRYLVGFTVLFPFVAHRYTPPRTSHLLVIGNSITKCPPCAVIGWAGNWGMAATAREKDWVHRLQASMPEDTTLTIVHGHAPDVATRAAELEGAVSSARASVVAIQIGDNMLPSDANEESLYQPMVRLIEAAFEARRHAKVVVLGTWDVEDVRNALMRQAAEDGGASFLRLDDLGARPGHRAWEQGVFDDPAVGWHPSDLGMAAIAERVAIALGYPAP